MYLLLIIASIFSCSAIPLVIYNNARFQSDIFDWLSRNLSNITSRDQCKCQCYFDQWCLTASYSAIDQQCSMFAVELYNGQINAVAISEQSSVLTFTNKTLPPPVRLVSTNETVYAIWNTIAGGNSSSSSVGTNTSNYYTGQGPEKAFDQIVTTKYTNFGSCSLYISGVQCGLNTGLYLTLQRGPSVLRSIRFCTGGDLPQRDPLTITVEGSNEPLNVLPYGTSWSLIYNGSSNLQTVIARDQCSNRQTFLNNYLQYTSYRILVTSKRSSEVATQYSEMEFYGY